jgi:hypothetical protein
MISLLSDSLRGGIRQNIPSAVGGKCLAGMGLGSPRLNSKSVVVRYDDNLARERESSLVRFPVLAPLNACPVKREAGFSGAQPI